MSNTTFQPWTNGNGRLYIRPLPAGFTFEHNPTGLGLDPYLTYWAGQKISVPPGQMPPRVPVWAGAHVEYFPGYTIPRVRVDRGNYEGGEVFPPIEERYIGEKPDSNITFEFDRDGNVKDAYVSAPGGFWTKIVPIVLAVSSIVFGPQMLELATAIGTAVGATGAFATMLGQTAIATVVNGGNVEKAISNTGVNFVSNGIGGNIGQITDSAAIGKAVAAATAAAMRNGNIDKALLTSLVQSGAANYAPQTGVPTMDYEDQEFDFDGNPIGGDDFDFDFDGNPVVDIPASNVVEGDGFYTVAADGGTYIMYDDGSIQFVGADGHAYALNQDGTTQEFNPQTGETLATSIDTDIDWGGFFDKAVAVVTAGTNTALKLINVWNQFGQKKPRVAATTVLPNGGRSTPNKNGTITVVTNGRSVTTPMPVGQPYTFADGTTVVNNGNGTISTINANGQTEMVPIGSQGLGGLGGNTGLIVMGALAAGLLFMGTRK